MSSRARPEGEVPSPGTDQQRLDAAVAQIRASLEGLRFGTITIIVQDGVVVQIERTEKTRLPR